MEKSVAEPRILDVMRFWACGSRNAKSREKLLEKINEGIPKDDQLTDRTFREIYAELSATHLLGSHPDIGYFQITCKADLELALNSLDRASASIAVRKNRIFHNYQERYGTVDRQMELLA